MPMKTKPASKEYIEWLRENVQKLLPMARKIVATGEQHVPAMFIFPKDPEIAVQIINLAPFFSVGPDGKDFASMIHQAAADDEEVDCCMLVIEAYMITARVEHDGKTAKIEPPVSMAKSIEDHPQRQEAITFNAIKDGMQLIASFIIKRPDNTLADTWDILVDPKTGILEGIGAGEPVTASVGRMVIDDRDIH